MTFTPDPLAEARRQRRIEAATKLLRSPVPGEVEAARAALKRLQGWEPAELDAAMDRLFRECGVLCWHTGDGRIEIEGATAKTGRRLHPPAFIRHVAEFMADAGRFTAAVKAGAGR